MPTQIFLPTYDGSNQHPTVATSTAQASVAASEVHDPAGILYFLSQLRVENASDLENASIDQAAWVEQGVVLVGESPLTIRVSYTPLFITSQGKIYDELGVSTVDLRWLVRPLGRIHSERYGWQQLVPNPPSFASYTDTDYSSHTWGPSTEPGLGYEVVTFRYGGSLVPQESITLWFGMAAYHSVVANDVTLKSFLHVMTRVSQFSVESS